MEGEVSLSQTTAAAGLYTSFYVRWLCELEGLLLITDVIHWHKEPCDHAVKVGTCTCKGKYKGFIHLPPLGKFLQTLDPRHLHKLKHTIFHSLSPSPPSPKNFCYSWTECRNIHSTLQLIQSFGVQCLNKFLAHFLITAKEDLYSWRVGANLQLGMADDKDVWKPEKVTGKKIENRRTLSVSAGGQYNY